MKKNFEKTLWINRWNSLKKTILTLLPGAKAFFRGKYPVGKKTRWLFDACRQGLKQGKHKAALLRITAKDTSFGVCLGILVMYLFYGIVVVPALGRESGEEYGFSVQNPGVPDPNDPNAPMSVYVRFDRSVAPLDMIDREVAEGIRIEPAIDGTWRWQNDQLLIFVPTEKWKPGADYRLSFKKSVFARTARVKRLTDTVSAPPIRCSFSDSEFYIHPDDPKLRFLSATLNSNYAVSLESVKKNLRARFAGKSLGLSVKADETGTKFYVQSDTIDLPAESESATISLEGEIDSPAFSAKKHISDTARILVPSEQEYASIDNVDIQYLLDDSSKYFHALVVNTRGRTTVKRVAGSIEAWVLPKDLPASPGTEAIKDYGWDNSDLIGPEVMKLSRKIGLKSEPSETESTQMAAFSLAATPSSHIYVIIKAGLSFNGGYKLKKDYRIILHTDAVPQSARFLKEGVLMSSRGQKSLTVISYGIERISFRVARVIPDQANHLITQSRGDFTALEFSGQRGYDDEGSSWGFDETNVSKIYQREFDVSEAMPGEPSYTTLDLTKFMETDLDQRMRYGLFLVDAYRSGDEGRSRIARRLIMVSDLGFMVKRSLGGTNEVFVMGIRSGQPSPGAVVSVIGKNGLEVARTVTDSEGHASLPDLRGLQREKTPVAFVVKNDEDMTFLPYDRDGRFLDYSNFDIGGEYEASARSKLSAFLFTDRGIYRPGETAEIGIVVKQKDWTEPISGVKLVLRVSDPRGYVVLEKKVDPGAYGLTESKFETRSWSPTGEYQAGLYIAKEKEEWISLGSATFKVEEFLPDRLKIQANILPKAASGWIKPEGISAAVKLDNLFGNPAAGNTLEASVDLVPAEPFFEGYRDYEFQISGEQPATYSLDLPPAATDEEGKAVFELPTSEFKSPLYRVNFYCQGFEKEGGRNVAAMAQALVSPLDFIVGFSADGSLGYINRNSTRNLRFIAVNPALETTSAPGLELVISKREWVSILTRMENGLYKYRSIEKKSEVSRKPFDIGAKGSAVKLDSSEPGEFEFIIEKAGTELLKRKYAIIGQGNVTRSLDQNAELTVKLDKPDYDAGDTIRVSLNAPYAGTGLITIERDKIYAWKWFSADSSASVQSIVLPAGLRGNAYVNVSFIRASDSREVYMSPLCYGVANFTIARGSLENVIKIDAPATARPGETLDIKYSSDYPGKMVLYGVDEGILQVAKYRLPDPLAFFLRKRALEVSTSQILDLILPNFIDDRSPAMGGDEGLEELARNLNPFKRRGQAPVAFWSGVIDCGPEGRSYSYTVPDYFNGSLKIMAVSVGRDSLGSSERRTVIKDKVIVMPQLPNFISPNDDLTIPVTVTNNVPGSGKDAAVRVTLSTGAGLAPESREQNAKASENGDCTVYFKVKAIDRPGAVNLTFTAAIAGASSSYTSEISVRPAVAFRTIVKTGRVASGKKNVAVNEKKYYPEYRRLDLNATYLPLGLSKGLLDYLESYPYGCSEQIVSQSFPKVALYSLPGFEAFSYEKVSVSVDAVCDVLLSRQNQDGSIGLWSANGEASAFASAYAAHFLTEARSKGFSIPSNLTERLFAYLKESARAEPQDWDDAYCKAYGVYILTRNEKVMTDEINSLKAWLKKNPGGYWEDSAPGLFLATSYSLLKMDQESKSILDTMQAALRKAKTDFWIGFPENETAVKGYLHAKHFPKSRQDILATYPDRFAALLEDGRYSSFSSSMTILALAEYAKLSLVSEQTALAVMQKIGDKASPIPLKGVLFFSASFSPEASSLSFDNTSKLPLFYQVTSEGFESTPPNLSENHGVEVYHEIDGLDGKKLSETVLGDEVIMKTRFRSLSDSRISDLVIVDLLPGGFDPDIESIRALGDSGGIDYIDIREDRVIFYLSAQKNVNELSYRLRSVTRGSFNMAPSYSVSMYDPAIWSMNAASAVTVK